MIKAIYKMCKPCLGVIGLLGLSALSVAQQPQPWVGLNDHTGRPIFYFEVEGNSEGNFVPEQWSGQWPVVNAAPSLPDGSFGDVQSADELVLFQMSERSLAAAVKTSKGLYEGILQREGGDSAWSGLVTNEHDKRIPLLILPDTSGIAKVYDLLDEGIDYAEFVDFWILYSEETGQPLARIELLRGDSADAGGFFQIFDTVGSPLGFAPPSARSDVKVKDGQLIGKFPTDEGTFTLFMELTETMSYRYTGGLRLDNATQDIIPVSMGPDMGRGGLPEVPTLWETQSGVNIAASSAMDAALPPGNELGEPLSSVGLYTCQQPRCFYTSASDSPFLVDVPLLQGWSVIEESSYDAMPQLRLRHQGHGETVLVNPMGDADLQDLACFRLDENGDDLLCQTLYSQDDTADLVDMIIDWRQAQLDVNLGAELYKDL